MYSKKVIYGHVCMILYDLYCKNLVIMHSLKKYICYKYICVCVFVRIVYTHKYTHLHPLTRLQVVSNLSL